MELRDINKARVEAQQIRAEQPDEGLIREPYAEVVSALWTAKGPVLVKIYCKQCNKPAAKVIELPIGAVLQWKRPADEVRGTVLKRKTNARIPDPTAGGAVVLDWPADERDGAVTSPKVVCRSHGALTIDEGELRGAVTQARSTRRTVSHAAVPMGLQ